jgi:hypothetical protein
MHTGVCGIAGVTPGKGRDRPDGGMHPGACITRAAPREYGMMGENACRSMHDIRGDDIGRVTQECMPEGACEGR